MRRDDLPLEQITYGSVCSGIEAATVAFRPLGWHAAWFAEIEPFPCALLKHHYPDVPNLGDMTQIARMIRDGYVPAPTMLWGGTPCQAFSIAGLRNSLDDARGNLSLVFCEIADEIDKRRAADGLLPAIIGWENVPGVLSTADNAFGCFLAGLAGEDDPIEPPGGKWPNAGCVYGPKRTVAWRVLDAQYFGVAQRRRRVFVIASAREGFDPAEVLFEFDGVRRDTPPRREAGQESAAATLRSTDGGSDVDHATGGYLQPFKYFGGGGDVDQSNIGNQAIKAHACFPAAVCPTLRAGGNRTGGDRPPGTDVDTADSLVPIAFSMKDYGGDASFDLAPTLRAGNHSASHANGGNPPAIAFDARQTPVSSTDVFGALGSSSPQAQAQAQAVCVTGDIAHTLKAEGFDASEDGTGRGQPIVAALALRGREGGATAEMGDDCGFTLRASTGDGDKPHALVGMAVRRLTPRECERLQSFPDDYTLIPFGRVIKMEKLEADWIKYLLRGGVMTLDQVCQAAADGPRYKALGNSWCVYNVRWIGRRIDAALTRLNDPVVEIARVA